MEDGFWLFCSGNRCRSYSCLNPYSDGRWFLVVSLIFYSIRNILGLNPYSDGRWFLVAIEAELSDTFITVS